MGPIRLLAAPLRRIANSRLFQFAVVVGLILLLENFSDNQAILAKVADGLDKVVETTVEFITDHLVRLRTFTKSLLTDSVMIGYVYVACLLIFALLRYVVRMFINFAGRNNFLWLRSTIARERGIAAYNAWLPLERIRPDECPQEVWEERFAWPKNNKPPYPRLIKRVGYELFGYFIVLAAAAVLVQMFTPFPVITWIGQLI